MFSFHIHGVIRGTWTGTPNQRFIRNFRVVVLEYLVWWHSSRTPLPHHLSSKCNHYMSLSTISVGGWVDGWMDGWKLSPPGKGLFIHLLSLMKRSNKISKLGSPISNAIFKAHSTGRAWAPPPSYNNWD